MSRRDVTATLSQYHTILEKILDKQRDCKSKQTRLHRQMKRIHKEYKSLKGSQKEVHIVCHFYLAFIEMRRMYWNDHTKLLSLFLTVGWNHEHINKSIYIVYGWNIAMKPWLLFKVMSMIDPDIYILYSDGKLPSHCIWKEQEIFLFDDVPFKQIH